MSAGSSRGRTRIAVSCPRSERRSIAGALGDAHAKEWPGAMMPALAALASRPTPSCSSTQRDLVAVLRQEVRGRDAGDAAPQDEDPHVGAPPDARIRRGLSRPQDGARAVGGRGGGRACGLEHPAEEPGVRQDQPVVVDLDLAREVRVDGLVPVAPPGFEARVALALDRDSEIRKPDVDDPDRLGLAAPEAKAADGQRVCEGRGREVDVNRPRESGSGVPERSVQCPAPSLESSGSRSSPTRLTLEPPDPPPGRRRVSGTWQRRLLRRQDSGPRIPR